jgi:hypothetical protein
LEEEIAAIYQAYKRLKDIGGRPVPINDDPGLPDPSKSDIDKENYISDY